jgi:NADPH:quinone reductase-like Zn-dependent oxidoreductase
MKAVLIHSYGGVEKLAYEDAPVPAPGPNQVLVKVHAAGVNPFDHKLASGAFAKFIPLKLPYIPGADFSGVVEKLGADVRGFNVGDAVYGNCQPYGAYAQFAAAPAGTIAPKPKTVDDLSAASIPTGAQTAWQAIFNLGRLERGQTVLIHASAGGVGSFAVQLAHWKGARVIATASGKNVDYVRLLGADEVIDYKTTRFESAVKDIDLVLDLLGGETQARSFGVVKAGGRLISSVQPPSQDAAKARGIQAEMVQMRASTENLAEIAKLIDAGTVKVPAVQTFPLASVAEAWKQILSGHMQGKIVLVV